MKKFLVALLIIATVVMAGVVFTIRFPRTTSSLRQRITRIIPQKTELPKAPITEEVPDEAVAINDVVDVVPPSLEEEAKRPALPEPTHIRQELSNGSDAQLIDNVQDYQVNEKNRIKKQAVINQSPINVQGGVEFASGFLVNSDRAIKGITFSSDGKVGDWHFGDGTTAPGSVVKHAYGKSGVYNVTFLAQESGTTYLTQTKIIVGGVIPKFEAENTAPRVGEIVEIDGINSKTLVGSITNYKWFCSDMQAGQCVFSNPEGSQGTVQFGEPGIYEISLTTTNNIGARETISQTFSVSGEKPVAKIVSIEPSGRDRHPGEYVFDATRSVNILGQKNDLLYVWDFDGDGDWEKRTTTPRVLYEYTRAGEKTVQLWVEHDHNRDTLVSDIVSMPLEDVSTIWGDFEAPFVLTAGELFRLRSQTQDLAGTAYQWKIEPNINVVGEGDMNAPEVAISFSDAEVYAITLTVTKDDDSDSITKFVRVRDQERPLSIIQYLSDKESEWDTDRSAVSVLRNERGMAAVRLRAHSVDQNGTVGCEKAKLNYSWSVRGVPVSTQCDPGAVLNQHFKEAGVYLIELIVYKPGNQNVSDTTSFLVEIKNKDPEFSQPIFYETNEAIGGLSAGPQNFIVTASAKDIDTTKPITQYFFEPMEDGIVLPDTQLLSTGQAYFNLSQFDGAHTFSFRVTATDSDGGTQVSEGMGTYSFENVIEQNHPPIIADFMASKSGIASGEFVRFDVMATDKEMDRLTYKWIVSQEGSVLRTEQTEEVFVEIPFLESGTYTVQVEVSDGTNTVSVESPQMIYVRD
jgi:PKD repeat protein